MTINVTSRGTAVKDSFQEMLEKKMARFDRLFEEDARAEVTVINEGGRETVEITIHSDGMVFRSEATTRERLESLDMVADTLYRQIVKNRSKLTDRIRRAAGDKNTFKEMDISFVEGDMDEEEEFKILRTKQFLLKPMNEQEAILQMNLLNHSFFVFLNCDTDDVNVVYKRKDGNYGLIEPEFA